MGVHVSISLNHCAFLLDCWNPDSGKEAQLETFNLACRLRTWRGKERRLSCQADLGLGPASAACWLLNLPEAVFSFVKTQQYFSGYGPGENKM